MRCSKRKYNIAYGIMLLYYDIGKPTGHKANTSTWCVLETEMQIPAKFVNTKIGGIIMSVESKVYRLTNGNLMARELYDIDREIYNFLCVHTVEVARQFFGWKRIKELQK